jgi:hypothetical protein
MACILVGGFTFLSVSLIALAATHDHHAHSLLPYCFMYINVTRIGRNQIGTIMIRRFLQLQLLILRRKTTAWGEVCFILQTYRWGQIRE